jgi:peptidoglycan/xylan/chitin deacetylase (PgdA/CDA1 family)
MKICSETYNDISIPSNLMMSWEDIIYLKNCGANIGSHTHPLMNNIELDLEIKNEFEISKKNLFEKLKESPITISFPVGSVNERIKKIARESGYKIGLAVRGEVFNSQLHDHFEIPRIELYEERMLKFILREKGVIQNSKKIFDFHLSRKRINN